MVKESRTVFDLKDVRRFRIACANQNCTYEFLIHFPLPIIWRDFQSCPACKQDWVREEKGLLEFQILDMISNLLSIKLPRPIRLRLEIES